MADREPSQVNRRGFLQGGAVAATASAMTSLSGSPAAAAPDESKPTLPRRPLGKTGVEVTILELGTWRSPGLNRLLRQAYDSGVRAFDSADCYGSEPAFARWFREKPEVRKEIFLVTKDHPRSPRDLLKQIDRRLALLGTDYVDLFMIHGIGVDYGDASLEWPRSQEFKETAEALKKSGKVKFVGFSCHDQRRAEYLQAAADGGFVDAIMLQYTPWLDKDSPLNRALDACHEKGIGLISMKQITGHADLAAVARRVKDLKKKKLTPYQGLLHAIWTDERIAMANVSMRNTDQVREDTKAAKTYQPMAHAEILELRDAVLAAGPTFCGDCDGRCARAAGSGAALGDLTRLLTYHQQYGYKAEARRLFAELPEHARDWSGADLEAARRACPNGLDFAALLPRVDEHLA
jgi:aryl-alcohol dehydrogenase-like predicted oxidoreductase